MSEHARHAGNRGDVWKHAILLATLEQMLLATDKGTIFKYAETHAGAGSYRLLPGGSWGEGVGAIRENVVVCNPYTRILNLTPDHMMYYGSWTMAGWLADSVSRKMQSLLWEIDPAVVEEVESFGINMMLGDGFTGIIKHLHERQNLILIDPTYKDLNDWTRAQTLADRLVAANQPFLLWYPLTSRSADPARPRNNIEVRNSAYYSCEWHEYRGGCVMVAYRTPAMPNFCANDLARAINAVGMVSKYC
jgi:23S rRNA (adenine2030-N6)-methyltransferase